MTYKKFIDIKRNGLFTPDIAFEAIVKKQISKLIQPSYKCVDLVVTEVATLIQKLMEKVIKIYLEEDQF